MKSFVPSILVALFASLAIATAVADDIIVDRESETPCALADGSEDAPFCTIQEGIDAAFASGGGTVSVEEGVYVERIVMRPGVDVEGEDDDIEVVIEPPLDGGASPYVILGADDTELSDVLIRLTPGYDEPAVLLEIPNAAMRIDNVVFDGANQPNAIGVLIEGAVSSQSRIGNCVFIRLHVGIEAADTEVRITRNVFSAITRDAIYVRPPDSGIPPFLLPQLGDIDDLESSGFNRFRDDEVELDIDVSGINGDKGVGEGESFYIRNTAGGTVLAQINDWDVFTAAEIAARLTDAPPGAKLSGASDAWKQSDAVVIEPFIGKSVFPASIYVRIEDQETGLPISDATSRLFLGGADTQLNPAFDSVSSLFAFEGLAPNTYTVRGSAPGYSESSVVISVVPGAIEAREIALANATPQLDPPLLLRTVPESPSEEASPLIEGTATAMATITLFIDGEEAASTSAGAAGTFAINAQNLGLGVHTLYAVASQMGFRDSSLSNELIYQVRSAGEGIGEGIGEGQGEGSGEGQGERADIVIVPSMIAFGNVAIGEQADRVLTIENVSSIAVIGTFSTMAPFSVLGTTSFSVPPESTIQMILRFTPTIVAQYNEVAIVQLSETIQLSITGSGVRPNDPTEGSGDEPNQGCAAGPASAARGGDVILLLALVMALRLSTPGLRHRIK